MSGLLDTIDQRNAHYHRVRRGSLAQRRRYVWRHLQARREGPMPTHEFPSCAEWDVLSHQQRLTVALDLLARSVRRSAHFHSTESIDLALAFTDSALGAVSVEDTPEARAEKTKERD